MHMASQVPGRRRRLPACSGPSDTMLEATVPVVAVLRRADRLAARARPPARSSRCCAATGKRVVVVRHPMPYGDLVAPARAALRDASRTWTRRTSRSRSARSTSRTSRSGTVVYAGVDYGAILEQAQQECDVLLWDGGNNDFPFYRPDRAHHGGRPAARRPRGHLPPGRDQPPDGRRAGDQQDRLGHARAGAAVEEARSRPAEPRRHGHQGAAAR